MTKLSCRHDRLFIENSPDSGILNRHRHSRADSLSASLCAIITRWHLKKPAAVAATTFVLGAGHLSSSDMLFQSSSRLSPAASTDLAIPPRRRGLVTSLALVAMLALLGLRTGHAQPASPQSELSFAPASFPTGTVSSTATGCLAAGYGDADHIEADVYVVWSGTVTSAKLVGDEFNVNWRSDIYLNNTLIGQSILDPPVGPTAPTAHPYPAQPKNGPSTQR